MRLAVKPRAVLDASAVLAFLQRERGYEVVRPILHSGAISTVNLAEVLVKSGRRGLETASLALDLTRRGLRFFDFTPEDAARGADLDRTLERKGALSTADRACIALGRRLGLPVYTADKVWEELALGVQVRAIR